LKQHEQVAKEVQKKLNLFSSPCLVLFDKFDKSRAAWVNLEDFSMDVGNRTAKIQTSPKSLAHFYSFVSLLEE
jgi:hypothetical protein